MRVPPGDSVSTAARACGQGKVLHRKTYFSNGNRGVIYTAELSGADANARPVKVAVKELLHEKLLKPGRISCPAALEREARWLRFMNQHGIGPTLHHADAKRVVMEFIPGRRILEFVTDEHDAAKCKQVLIAVLQQLRLLDVLDVHKGELVKPDRHILVRDDGTPVLIDFERCKHTTTPQNVLQVCQFLASNSLAQALAANGKRLALDCSGVRDCCRAYKGNGYLERDFESILAIVETAAVVSSDEVECRAKTSANAKSRKSCHPPGIHTCMYIHTCCVLIKPPIPSSRSKHLVFLPPNIFLLHKRANTRVHPCNDLENLFFEIYEVITS